MKKYRAKHSVAKADLRPDRFQQFTEKAVEFYYRDRQRFLIIVGVVVAVIIGLIFVLQGQRPKMNPEAQLRFTEALGMYAQGDMQQAEQAFRNVTARFGRDKAAVRARYYLGQINFHSQRYDEARAEFERFYKAHPKDPILGPAALIGIADCLQETGDLRKAAETYERAWRRYPDSPLAYNAVLAAGRNYAQAGALDRAERLYQSLLDEAPAGEQAENLKLQLSYVRTLREKF